MNQATELALVGLCFSAFFGWSVYSAVKTGKTNLGVTSVRGVEQAELFWTAVVGQAAVVPIGLHWLIAWLQL